MVNMIKPDERAVMTYVSCYYHALKGAYKVITCNDQSLLLIEAIILIMLKINVNNDWHEIKID